MGTNFYVDLDVCSACHRGQDRIHIGKRSGGWKFLWQGFQGAFGPVKKAIKTREEWYQLLSDPASYIIDEYNTPYSFTEFKDMVTQWDAMPSNLMRHSSEHPSIDSWRDAEGFEFLAGDFS